MYAYIKGTLEETGEDYIVVEAGGIGYQIFTTGQTFQYLPSMGEEVKVYTYLHVREDAMILFGFLTKDDLFVFRLLLGVSGIGPKGALAILSVMTTDDLRFAVLGDDAKAIAKAPGVGAKTAQRLILELKDKLSLEDTSLGLFPNAFISDIFFLIFRVPFGEAVSNIFLHSQDFQTLSCQCQTAFEFFHHLVRTYN
jgi:Holliday junction DNA helicase RuvA subunit